MTWNPPAIFVHDARWVKAGQLQPARGVVVHSMGEHIVLNQVIYPAQEWLDRQYELVPGGAKVSAHALVKPDGTIVRCASHLDKCNHAGLSVWKKWLYLNKNFLSIEVLVEGNHTWSSYLKAIKTAPGPYTENQHRAVAWMVQMWKRECPELELDNLAAHSTVSPGRKPDPGPYFDWPQMRAFLAEYD